MTLTKYDNLQDLVLIWCSSGGALPSAPAAKSPVVIVVIKIITIIWSWFVCLSRANYSSRLLLNWDPIWDSGPVASGKCDTFIAWRDLGQTFPLPSCSRFGGLTKRVCRTQLTFALLLPLLSHWHMMMKMQDLISLITNQRQLGGARVREPASNQQTGSASQSAIITPFKSTFESTFEGTTWYTQLMIGPNFLSPL